MADDSNGQDQVNRGQQNKATPELGNTLQHEALGLPIQKDGAVSEENALSQQAWDRDSRIKVQSGIDYRQMTEDADNAWKFFMKEQDPGNTGQFNKLRNSLIELTNKKLLDLKETPTTEGSALDVLRGNLHKLRELGVKLTPAEAEFNYVFNACGKNNKLVEDEFTRLSGLRKDGAKGLTPPIQLHQGVYKNGLQYFSMDKEHPWDRAAAADKLGLTGDYDKELDRLYDRWTVAAIFANVDERGRWYFQKFHKAEVDEGNLANWEVPLKINDPNGLSAEDKKELTLAHGTTLGEVDQMHRIVSAIQRVPAKGSS